MLVTPSTEPNPNHDFLVANIPTYLKHARSKAQDQENIGDLRRLIKVRNTSIATIDALGLYGDEDIPDILPKVFPKRTALPSAFRLE